MNADFGHPLPQCKMASLLLHVRVAMTCLGSPGIQCSAYGSFLWHHKVEIHPYQPCTGLPSRAQGQSVAFKGQNRKKPFFGLFLTPKTSEKIIYIKPWIRIISFLMNFFVWPTLIGAALLIFRKSGKPDFRVRMDRDGSEKKILILNHI